MNLIPVLITETRPTYILLNKDENREQREYKEVSWAEEIKCILRAEPKYDDEDSMKDIRPKRAPQYSFKNATGDPNISLDVLNHAANRLESLQYNIPLYISGTTGPGTPVSDLQDVS